MASLGLGKYISSFLSGICDMQCVFGSANTKMSDVAAQQPAGIHAHT